MANNSMTTVHLRPHEGELSQYIDRWLENDPDPKFEEMAGYESALQMARSGRLRRGNLIYMARSRLHTAVQDGTTKMEEEDIGKRKWLCSWLTVAG